jgi:hypothetical protein
LGEWYEWPRRAGLTEGGIDPDHAVQPESKTNDLQGDSVGQVRVWSTTFTTLPQTACHKLSPIITSRGNFTRLIRRNTPENTGYQDKNTRPGVDV